MIILRKRIKEIRKNNDLSQEKFGERLGVTKTSISKMELGTYNITDTMIKLVCTEFNVNEHWLRTGEGEMFIETDNSLINDLVVEYKMSEKQKKIIAAFAAMNDKKREILAEAFFEFVDLVSASPEVAATVPARPAASDKRLTRAEKEELMKRQLDAEEKTEMLSVSTTTNGFLAGKMA